MTKKRYGNFSSQLRHQLQRKQKGYHRRHRRSHWYGFLDYPVRRAFTSQMIINKLRKRDGMEIDNEAESLMRAAKRRH